MTRIFDKIAAGSCDDDNMHVVCQLDSLSPRPRNSIELSHRMNVHTMRLVAQQEMNQKMQSMKDMVEKKVEEAMDLSNEIRTNMTSMMERIVTDFRNTIHSLEERLVMRKSGNGKQQVNSFE
jgi:hypothetical protein